MLPITSATNAQRPTAKVGSTQPRRRMFTMSSATANSEMSIRRLMAGSWAFTSV